ncbi:chorismate mutase [Ralstonia insidiosa]|jgi:chorismate mutase|uniref:chorismate mutase n=1 Tax=Ralstonia TaxID=48736 RepID=UPI0006648661|nr:chorismate mutase [Ralstonia insidiosa]KMW45678.1 chorismate mutase [Ralstonia sp. MD27]MBX3772532.1 chorismate mutase [Ralstonia pickettii]NPA01898.1 chorismate mutase [Betaproteobacteria bacterium]MBA9857188.1 chorismate mutase [Ralstonia insidiosa]MBA9870290.1 chorismate mutase [Ralstonia insidiosa]
MHTTLKPSVTIKTALLACAVCLVAGCATPVTAQESAFAPLLRHLADRLVTADQVALSKWDTGQSVYDPEREAKVIANVSGIASTFGLNATDVASVFADQIEANKEVQYALLNDWRRAGAAPTTPRQSLSGDIRPRLDTLQTSILQSLRDAAPARSQADCLTRVAQDIGRVAHEKSLDTLHRIALDRATARLCAKS